MVTITLTPELEQAAIAEAQRLGVSPQEVVFGTLRDKLLSKPVPALQRVVPQDEWERKLFSLASDAGVSLSDEAVSSEGLYD